MSTINIWTLSLLHCVFEEVTRKDESCLKLTQKRWIVERSIGWFGSCIRLSKDYEANMESSEAWVYIACISIMIRKILIVLKYCMSKNPLGPFEYKGVILRKMNSGTNHHSIVEYKGQWYMFYHNSDLYFKNHPEIEEKFGWGHKGSPHPFRRSICFDKLYYNADGTIQEVIPTK